MVHYDHGNGVAVADVDGDDALDIYFVSQQGTNQLWRNRGDGTFENITGRSPGLEMADRISVSASFADIDNNDGDPDLYVTTVNMGNKLFRNRGDGRMEDITAASGTGHVAHSSGAVFFDMDDDGLLDLFVTNVGWYTEPTLAPSNYYIGLRDAFSGHHRPERTEISTLYKNLGEGRFEDVTRTSGLVDPGWSGDASFSDFDRDGDLDLYVLNMQGDDRYWRNDGSGRFVEATSETFPTTPWGSMGLKFFDWDNDGDDDLLVTDMHSDMSDSVHPGAEGQKSRMAWSDEFLQGGANNTFGNAFFENADGTMSEVSDRVGLENYWPWGVSVGDLNADGFQDVLVVSSMKYPFRYVENALFLNVAGERFVRAEYVVGLEPRSGGPTKHWFDIDCPPGPDTPPPQLENVATMLRQCAMSVASRWSEAEAVERRSSSTSPAMETRIWSPANSTTGLGGSSATCRNGPRCAI